MFKKEDITEYDIYDVGINFEGIARDSNQKTVFVPSTLIGEKIKAKVEKSNSSYILAKPLEIIKTSPIRVVTDCEYYPICGGCKARHTTYDNTLDIKRKNVINTLKKQGIEVSSIVIYGMGNPYYYRNKVQYPLRKQNGLTVMGMFEEKSHKIVENKYCLIQNEQIEKVAKDLFKLVLENGLQGYDEKSLNGDIKNIMVRIGTNENEIMCVLVTSNRSLVKDIRLKNIIEKIIKKHKNIVSFIININEKNTNTILSNENVCVFGREYIFDRIGDLKFKITANSFFQVNTIQAELLYNILKEKMKLEKNKNLLELYSGVGSIGIFLASSVKNVYAVEIVESAAIMAKENANINQITNVVNVCGDALYESLKLVNEGKYFNYIVVDPPRKGLDLDVIEHILKLKPEKIGYISCNSATLARDLKMLSRDYDITSIDLVDLFPWTAHIESIAVLHLK